MVLLNDVWGPKDIFLDNHRYMFCLMESIVSKKISLRFVLMCEYVKAGIFLSNAWSGTR